MRGNAPCSTSSSPTRTTCNATSPSGRRKLEEYLDSVREVESRISHAEKLAVDAPDPGVESPTGVPSDHEAYIQVMYDLLVLAFQTDTTRVATFLVASEGSNRPFPEIGISEGHHSLTHHQNRAEMIEKVALIDRFYINQFAGFLEKMEKTKDANGGRPCCKTP